MYASYQFAADVVLVVHLIFIAFVVFGGVAVFKFPMAAWVHIPAAAWGVYVELSGRVCPLTTLEVELRLAGGGSAYTESFIEHYLEPVIYPAGLSREVQFWLGAAVVLINAGIYAYFYYLRLRRRRRLASRQ